MANVANLRTIRDWAMVYAGLTIPSLLLYGVTDDGRCMCGDPHCPSPGKHPVHKHGATEASADPEVLAGYLRKHSRWRALNLGIRMGGLMQSGDAEGLLFALDVDPRNRGDVELDELTALHGDLPIGPRQETGGGGYHLLFLAPKRLGPPRVGSLCQGVDVKSTNGYLVAELSRHRSGQPYRWSRSPEATPIPMAPDWLLERLFPAAAPAPSREFRPDGMFRTDAVGQNYADAGIPGCLDEIRAAREGERNRTLFHRACRIAELAAGRREDPEVWRADIVAAAVSTGLSERESNQACSSAFRHQLETGATAVGTAEAPPSEGELSALLEEFAQGKACREVPPPGDSDPRALDGEPLPPWVYTGADIAKPLPPIEWTIPELRLAAGPVSVLAAYGFSGKTMLGQSLAMSVAAGVPLFGAMDAPTQGGVLHWDCEQGKQVTVGRYQRMARAAGVDWASVHKRLLVADHCPHGLDTPEGQKALFRLAKSRRFCLVDSLRPAFPGVDENDSKIRAYLQVFARISAATGCTFLLLHHNRKEQQGPVKAPPEQAMRGSSGVFDEAQSVYSLAPDGAGAAILRQHKDRVGGKPIEPLALQIQDVAAPSESEWPDPQWGLQVTVVHDEEAEARQEARGNNIRERVARMLIDRGPPGVTTEQLRNVLNVRNQDLRAALSAMELDGAAHKVRNGRRQFWAAGRES